MHWLAGWRVSSMAPGYRQHGHGVAPWVYIRVPMQPSHPLTQEETRRVPIQPESYVKEGYITISWREIPRRNKKGVPICQTIPSSPGTRATREQALEE